MSALADVPNLVEPVLCLALLAFTEGDLKSALEFLRLKWPLWLQPQGLGEDGVNILQRYRLSHLCRHLILERAAVAGSVSPQGKCADTWFVDPGLALSQARRGEKIERNKALHTLQLCYTHAVPAGEEGLLPENFLVVPEESLATFFNHSGFRWPTQIRFDPASEPERLRALDVAVVLDFLSSFKPQALKAQVESLKSLAPTWDANQPLRVFLAASRQTTVMQYNYRDIAAAFRRAGAEVCFVIEQNDHQEPDSLYYMSRQEAFRPHVTININNQNNHFLHPDVFNVIWWQDPMPAFMSGKALPKRERDIVFCAHREYDPFLNKCGVDVIHRQGFCVDTELFRGDIPWEERKKVVFVGSSYRHYDETWPRQHKWILDFMRERFLSGQYLTRKELEDIARRSGLSLDDEVDRVYGYVVRDTTVAWLCSLADEIPWEIEIYGRYWESNPIVRPFFKGEVEHGKNLANVYGQARYGLNANPSTVLSQRLVEMAACGCVPVVVDDRKNAEPPHWDEHCLFFPGRDALRACLQTHPQQDPKAIAQAYSYDAFVQRIVGIVRSWPSVEFRL
ncbi:MAG: glycosyltransferase [Magnetococcales bacterium]|nr:glycosyltransferase [Magnetococcales bacterium]